MVRNCVDDLENKKLGENAVFYNELEKFDGGRKGHDDMCDATADAFAALNTSSLIPNFTPPEMTQHNPFTREYS
jgi:hypothetical protein